MFFPIVILPSIVFVLFGAIFDAWGAGAFVGLVWIGYAIFNGTQIVKQQEFLVTEVLGKCGDQGVRFAGWHVLLPWVEQIRAQGDLRTKRLSIYGEGAGTLIDFKDGTSAPVVVSAWYQVGEPNAVANQNWTAVAKDVRLWVYTYTHPEDRIRSLIDGALRPLLQMKDIDEANVDRNGLAEQVMSQVAPEMRKFGAYPQNNGVRLVIEDIKIPPEIARMRAQVLEAKKVVERATREAMGTAQVINLIARECGMNQEDARKMYMYLRGLETIKSTGANVTLIGSGIQGVVGTLNMDKR